MKKLYLSRNIVAITFALVALLAASNAFAALNAYLTIKGDKHKSSISVAVDKNGIYMAPALKADNYTMTFNLESKPAGSNGKRMNKIEAIVIKQEVIAPRDQASGMATGKRMHKPITMTAEIDRTAPQVVSKPMTFTLDTDCDGLKGTVTTNDKMGKKTAMDDWEAK